MLLLTAFCRFFVMGVTIVGAEKEQPVINEKFIKVSFKDRVEKKSYRK